MTSDHLSVLNMFKTSWLKFYRCMCVCAPVMVARMRPALLLRAQICPSKGRKNFHFYTGNMAGQNWPQQPDRARKGPNPPFLCSYFLVYSTKICSNKVCICVVCGPYNTHTHTRIWWIRESERAHSSSSVPDPGVYGGFIARAKRTQLY